MTTIKIRRFDSDDLAKVLNLLIRYLDVDWKRKSGFRRRFLLGYILSVPFNLLGKDTFVGAIAETNDDHIIGAVIARRFPFGKSWVLGPVILHPNSRGSGIATRMMNFTLKELTMKKANLAVLSVGTNNIQARSFFEKLDFKYFGPVFMDHDQARKYVQIFALILGYFKNAIHKIPQYPLETKITHSDQKSRTNRMRTWHMMLREL